MGSLAEALVLLANVSSGILVLAQNSQQISALIQKATAEGRTTFTPDEWKIITGGDDAARQVLADAITKALTAGK
jgi:hypothetical protein